MTSPLTFPDNRPLNRRRLMKGAAALAATAVTVKAASAETVAPLGQTGAPTMSTTPLPLGTATRKPLSGFSPGVCQEADKPSFGPRLPGLRRHHGG